MTKEMSKATESLPYLCFIWIQMRRVQTAEMRFVRAVAGYRMTDHKRNEDIRELGITDVNTIMK